MEQMGGSQILLQGQSCREGRGIASTFYLYRTLVQPFEIGAGTESEVTFGEGGGLPRWWQGE